MRKTIAVAALGISTNALALWPEPGEQKTICIKTYENENGEFYGGNCDESTNNGILGLPIGQNGCAEGQVSIHSIKPLGGEEFTVKVPLCLPPNVTQL